MTKDGHKLAGFRNLCCLGLGAQTSMPALLRAVREIVPSDSAGFFWVNGEGEMTNFYAERVLPERAMKLFFERYHDGAAGSFKDDFQSRVDQQRFTDVLEPDPSHLKTDYYNDILRELDAHHILRAVVREAGSALGQLSLYRDERSPTYNKDDCERVSDISKYLAHALSARTLTASNQEFVDTEDEGVIVVDAQGRVKHAANGSRRLLLLATHPTLSSADSPSLHSPQVSNVIRELVFRLHAVYAVKRGSSSTAGVEPPRLNLANGWGQFALRAYWLDELMNEESSIAVHIRRREPLTLKLAENIRKLELPPQLQQVALFIAQGKSNVEIADEANLSENTVRWHVKQLFARLDLHERAELERRLRA
jgi:Bacterial regulatory proteins, luxR family